MRGFFLWVIMTACMASCSIQSDIAHDIHAICIKQGACK